MELKWVIRHSVSPPVRKILPHYDIFRGYVDAALFDTLIKANIVDHFETISP